MAGERGLTLDARKVIYCIVHGQRGCPLSETPSCYLHQQRKARSKRQVFVGGPITDPDFNRIYEQAICPALVEVSQGWDYELIPYRADLDVGIAGLWCKICQNLIKSVLAVTDMTCQTPNVAMELGLALGLGMPAIVLKKPTLDSPVTWQG